MKLHDLSVKVTFGCIWLQNKNFRIARVQSVHFSPPILKLNWTSWSGQVKEYNVLWICLTHLQHAGTLIMNDHNNRCWILGVFILNQCLVHKHFNSCIIICNNRGAVHAYMHGCGFHQSLQNQCYILRPVWSPHRLLIHTWPAVSIALLLDRWWTIKINN